MSLRYIMAVNSYQASRPWQDRCSNITEALNYMLEKEIIVDATLIRNKVPALYTHKLVLAIWSPVFADLVAGVGGRNSLSISFSEDIDVMKVILTYLYSPDSNKSFSNLSINNLIQVIEFSQRYGMVHVQKKSMNCLQRKKVCPQNVLELFDYGLCKNLENIVIKCSHVLTHQGIVSKIQNGGISLDTVVQLLSLEKIAMQSEFELLCLVISWLSFPQNMCHKDQVLSLIDFNAIGLHEYQQILREYPDFFSNYELSSISLGVIHQDSLFYPEWYKSKITSVFQKDCVSCVNTRSQLNIRSDLINNPDFLKKIKYGDVTNICQTYEFEFQDDLKPKLSKAELCFGPKEISDRNFTVTFRKTGTRVWKKCSVSLLQGNNKYSINFHELGNVNRGEKITLKFRFREKMDNIITIFPNVIERQKLNGAFRQECISVKLHLEVVCYLLQDEVPKLIVSSFNFMLCDHTPYLIRKCIEHGESELPDTDKETSLAREQIFRDMLKEIEKLNPKKKSHAERQCSTVEIKQEKLDFESDGKYKGIAVKREKPEAESDKKINGIAVKRKKPQAESEKKINGPSVKREKLDAECNLKNDVHENDFHINVMAEEEISEAEEEISDAEEEISEAEEEIPEAEEEISEAEEEIFDDESQSLPTVLSFFNKKTYEVINLFDHTTHEPTKT